ncbi:hypothetical protein, partial [Pseudomonas aeruginosa]|uniref:hypothetical protein n=1 Tax=Pseudomonas aeruginosa TaxID=287 RepID=UPI00374989EA
MSVGKSKRRKLRNESSEQKFKRQVSDEEADPLDREVARMAMELLENMKKKKVKLSKAEQDQV